MKQNMKQKWKQEHSSIRFFKSLLKMPDEKNSEMVSEFQNDDEHSFELKMVLNSGTKISEQVKTFSTEQNMNFYLKNFNVQKFSFHGSDEIEMKKYFWVLVQA